MTAARFTIRDSFQPVSAADWRELVEQELKGASFERKLVNRTYEGIALQPLYTAGAEAAPADPSGFPGTMPFVRGARTALQVSALFSQKRGEPTLGLLRTCIDDDVAHGVGELELCLDQAARLGLDADDPAALDLVGVDGACLYSYRDLRTALEGIESCDVSISLQPGASFVPAAVALSAWWRTRQSGVTARGAFNADPFAALAREGKLPFSLSAAFDQLAALASWTSQAFPFVSSIGVSTAVYHRAGANAARDLGLSLATGVEYLRQLETRGLTPSVAARQMRFSYAVGTRPFMAIAKLRAARLTWARVLEACGVDEAARGMKMQVETSSRVLTRRDPWVNMLRNTACCFAATVAGADVVGSLPFDAALGLPSRVGGRVARNTPIILREEAHLDRVADAAGGSWLMESLTESLAAEAWRSFQEIEKNGGVARMLTTGALARTLRAELEPRQRNIATRRDPLIGVSEFPVANERPVEPTVVDLQTARAEARARLTRSEPQRDLDAQVAGKHGAELLELLVAASERGATIGQLSRALARLESSGAPPAQLEMPITPWCYAESFERLRDAGDRYAAEHGRRPGVFLANVGSLAQYTARSNYARSFFEAGGFDVTDGTGGEDAEAIAAQLRECAVTAAVICSSDVLYQQSVAVLAPSLRRAGATAVILAGNPGELEQTYREAGVDRFIHIGCDVVASLQELLAQQGVVS